MTIKILKEIWELICLVLLALPGMLVGYLAGFIVNGVVTGFALQQRMHKPSDSNKTSP